MGENFGRMEDMSGENSQEPGDSTKPRNWIPLQLKNPEYLETLKSRETTNRDFIMENIVSTVILLDQNIILSIAQHPPPLNQTKFNNLSVKIRLLN